MSTNPLPDAPQQHVTLSPDWSALLKIGRAYRLLFWLNLIWILLSVVYIELMAVFIVFINYDLDKSFHNSRPIVEGNVKAETESSLEPEADNEFQSTELADPAEKWEPRIPVFKGDTPMLILLGVFSVFLFTIIFQFVVQVLVMFRFANCPSSLVPGGHGVGLAYAICTGLFLLFMVISIIFVEDETSLVWGLVPPLYLIAFILFLSFAHKIAVAVRSQSGQRWLTILIVSICSFFITFFIACLLLDVPELYFLGVLAFVLLVIGDWCLIGFSFLKLYQHLGRDVPLFIEAAMAQYSGQ
ncbi:MAG: hypothetical protein IJK97_02750 [Thermoguttaceae bacterium]|nr:hypothetical protein [Thermoguttaceae bacterium]MBR0192881.1 hypothetical protein [Thermoguttaceae bacterium]